MESKSGDDSWSTLQSSSDSELQCSTCSSLDDEDCSQKRSEADHKYFAAAFRRPRFARQECFRRVGIVENDLAEEYDLNGDSDSDDCSSSSCSSGSEEDEEPVPETWSATDTRKTFPFTDTPVINAGSAETPLDYFYLVFNRNFVKFLADAINTRGTEIANIKKKVFIPTDVDEVYTLLSTNLMIYVLKYPERVFGNGLSLNLDTNSYMAQERFGLLFGLLLHRDTKATKAYQSWYDVAKPIADQFNGIMRSIMVPGKDLNIDKDTVLLFFDFNFLKRYTVRIRLHFISDDNGIFQRVFVVDPKKQQEVRGEKIAKALMEDFFDVGRSLHTGDAYYTSVTLAEDFLERKTYLSGVLKKNRSRSPAFLKYKVSLAEMPMRKYIPEPTATEKHGHKKTPVSKSSDKQPQSKEATIVHGFNKNGVCVAKIMRSTMKMNMISTEFNSEPAEDKKFECDMTEQLYKHTFLPRKKSLLSKCGIIPKRKFNRHVAYMIHALYANSYLLYKVNTGRKIKFINFLENILFQMLPLEAVRDEKENENLGKKKKPKRRRSDQDDNREECILM